MIRGDAGTLKIINDRREAELPEPSITEQFGGMLVEIFKNRFMKGAKSTKGVKSNNGFL